MLIVGEHLNKKLNVPLNKIGVIVGPSHAEEIAMERLSYLTIACIENKVARAMASLLKTQYIRTTIARGYGLRFPQPAQSQNPCTG